MKKIFPTLLLILGLSISFLETAHGQSDAYKTYCNVRFGFCIHYPGDFKDLGESDNSDGDIFESQADLKMQIRAFGSYNINKESPKKFLKSMEKELIAGGGSVSYKSQKKDFVVVSGIKDKGTSIYYSKTVFRDDRLLNLIVTYPKSVANKADPIVGKVSASIEVNASPE